ncbi:centrosomal protein of 85 kDa-like [Lineus longissimus]|uniref:centrosomal protein of 85 kDa-like n=1 Tax=Lineus longissimus TaxID=88925 RepID=UPI002B4D576D
MLETRHKKYQQAEAKQQIRVKQLEEQISQDESMVMAMKDEMDGKDDQLKKLRTSIKELGRQNQDLMEKNMILQDKAKELDRLLSSDQQKIQRKLVREMNTSITELQSLIEICMERSQGQDPNISVLLGVRAPSMAESEEEADANDVPALKKKLAQVRGLRKEIDKMRELISNKYAEDMGDNFNCTTS